MDEELQKRLAEFSRAERHLIDLWLEISNEDEGRVFGVDFLITAAVRRALSLLGAFKLLVENRYFLPAAALLRLQLDNSLRTYACTLVDDPHDLALRLLQGERVSRMKDREGKPMTDRRLVEKLSAHYPWILNVYEQTSGYVHLSDKHFFASIDSVHPEGVVKFAIGSREGDSFPSEAWIEVVEAFLEATRVFAKVMGSWWHVKAKAAEERRKEGA